MQPTPPAPLCDHPKQHWLIDEGLAFLNHGSFGAVPRVVLDEQTEWRERIERSPIAMMDRAMGALIEPAQWAAADLIGVAPESLAFVTNATAAINAVLRSMSFAPGDILAAPEQVYNAIRQTLRFIAERDGARYIEFAVPLDVNSSEELGQRFVDAIPNGTRLLVLDELSSHTAIRFPVASILSVCQERAIEVIIDGAHAPGMIELDVEKTVTPAVIAWTGNLHKWAFSPKGTAVLWVREDRRDTVHPPVISHFYKEGFAEEFKWQGTLDFSAWLSVPAALSFIETTFGWQQLRDHNNALARWAHAMLCDAWNAAPLSPLDGSCLGSMAAVRLPKIVQTRFESPDEMILWLYNKHAIEVPINDFNGDWLLRVSAQAYNQPAEYERLAEVVCAIR